jgi:hypothetical protein
MKLLFCLLSAAALGVLSRHIPAFLCTRIAFLCAFLTMIIKKHVAFLCTRFTHVGTQAAVLFGELCVRAHSAHRHLAHLRAFHQHFDATSPRLNVLFIETGLKAFPACLRTTAARVNTRLIRIRNICNNSHMKASLLF